MKNVNDVPGFEDKNATIVYENFSGNKSKYNSEGVRNFCLVVPTDVAIDLANAGDTPNAWNAPWNIKLDKPYSVDSDGNPLEYTLQVAVSYSHSKYKPVIKLITDTEYDETTGKFSGGKVSYLTENTVSILDTIKPSRIAVRIRPRFWDEDKANGTTKIKAYLQRMDVYVERDSFDELYITDDFNPGDTAPFDI